MKLSPYLNINRIEFIVTYKCSGHCKHCSVGDRLNHSDDIKHVLANNAITVVEEIAKLFPITSVMTFGGEPLLYPDVVCAIHETANRCGIGTKQVITNGYFTKDDERRRQVASVLSRAGVNSPLLSVDAFHQETIPIKVVYNFARYAKEAGIPNVKLSPAWVVNEQHDNPYNNKTREILNEFTNLAIPVAKGNNIFMAGNAIEHLAKFYDKPKLNLSDTCGSMPYTEPLTNITSLSVAPNGDVMICGFVIGNVNKQNLSDIITQFNPYENEWMNAILAGGASALLDMARQRGIAVDCSKCYSICDLCHTINNSC